MKKILFSIALLLLTAGLTSAQETYSIAATANQVTRVSRAVLTFNAKSCLRLNAVGGATCTQAQACTAAAAAGGASCTAAQARAANARIYPNTQPGREEFVTFALVARDVTDLGNDAVALDQLLFCAAFKAATAGNQNTACTSVGYTPVSGQCEVCP